MFSVIRLRCRARYHPTTDAAHVPFCPPTGATIKEKIRQRCLICAEVNCQHVGVVSVSIGRQRDAPPNKLGLLTHHTSCSFISETLKAVSEGAARRRCRQDDSEAPVDRACARRQNARNPLRE